MANQEGLGAARGLGNGLWEAEQITLGEIEANLKDRVYQKVQQPS